MAHDAGDPLRRVAEAHDEAAAREMRVHLAEQDRPRVVLERIVVRRDFQRHRQRVACDVRIERAVRAGHPVAERAQRLPEALRPGLVEADAEDPGLSAEFVGVHVGGPWSPGIGAYGS